MKSLYQQAMDEVIKDNVDLSSVADLLNESMNEENNPVAAYILAIWFIHGKFFVCDYESAVAHLKVAVDGGVIEAFADLGVCYENGLGVEANSRTAYLFYLQGALSGATDCFFEIGRCHFHGIGVSEDRTVADLWLKRAKKNGIEYIGPDYWVDNGPIRSTPEFKIFRPWF